MTNHPQTEFSQLEKFKQAARELETDDHSKCFDERMARLVAHMPVGKRNA